MDLVPIRCMGNDCKKYDDKVWWEDISTIVQLNNEPVENLHKSSLKNGDQVLVKFASSKAKKPKLYNGMVDFPTVTPAVPPISETSSDPEQPKPKKMKGKPASAFTGGILAAGLSNLTEHEGIQHQTAATTTALGMAITNTKSMHDEIKISWLQAQLQIEKQQRQMDALEHKLESKMEGISRKVDQILQSMENNINEVKQQQQQLMSRQDQLFSKQDQIQRSLADDSASVMSCPSVAWTQAQYPAQMSSGFKYTEPQAAEFMPPIAKPMASVTQPLSSMVSDVDSFNISDAELESLLSFEWNARNETGNETPHIQTPPDDAASSSRANEGVSLIAPNIIIQNNSRLCTMKDVGKMAAILARDSFFGVEILRKSTLSGKGNQQALDSEKVSSLMSAIHNIPAFSKMSRDEFSKVIKPKILAAIQHQCKYLRSKKSAS